MWYTSYRVLLSIPSVFFLGCSCCWLSVFEDIYDICFIHFPLDIGVMKFIPGYGSVMAKPYEMCLLMSRTFFPSGSAIAKWCSQYYFIRTKFCIDITFIELLC